MLEIATHPETSLGLFLTFERWTLYYRSPLNYSPWSVDRGKVCENVYNFKTFIPKFQQGHHWIAKIQLTFRKLFLLRKTIGFLGKPKTSKIILLWY